MGRLSAAMALSEHTLYLKREGENKHLDKKLDTPKAQIVCVYSIIQRTS